jgi:lipoate-protein ligase B
MKENKLFQSVPEKSNVNFTVIPDDILASLIYKQDQIIELLVEKKPAALNGFVTEKKAMELVNKKVTWFWQMRRSGKLAFKTIGRTVYYSLEDINALL